MAAKYGQRHSQTPTTQPECSSIFSGDARALFSFCALGYLLGMLLLPVFASGVASKRLKQQFARWLLE